MASIIKGGDYMHTAMRNMVDEEKMSGLEALLKQLYEKIVGQEADSEGEPPQEEMAEKLGVVPDDENKEEDPSMEAGESDFKDEKESFMKNKHKPKFGKGIGIMIKASASKPMKKANKF